MADQIRLEYFKSSGPGGQHKNKRFTAVRAIHIPTGIVAVAATERLQSVNKEIALKRLGQKLYEMFRPRKKRIACRPSKAAQERVLAWKRKHSLKKSLRRGRLDEG